MVEANRILYVHFICSMKKYGRMYPHAGYGGCFRVWLRSMDTEPYNSFDNGSAMRVSPCAWVMDCGFCARTGMWPNRDLARLSASVTHNHPEGIKGALAVCDAIFMARFFLVDGILNIQHQLIQIRMSVKEESKSILKMSMVMICQCL